MRALREDPVLTLLDQAPPDDEPLDLEDEAAIEEALQDVPAGRVRLLNDVLLDLMRAPTERAGRVGCRCHGRR
jgi:hypothetical protein